IRRAATAEFIDQNAAGLDTHTGFSQWRDRGQNTYARHHHLRRQQSAVQQLHGTDPPILSEDLLYTTVQSHVDPAGAMLSFIETRQWLAGDPCQDPVLSLHHSHRLTLGSEYCRRFQ